MENNNGSLKSEAQGVEDVPPEKVAEWLKKDIGAAMTLLKALYDDYDLRLQMAVWLQGRYVNAKNAEINAKEAQR